MTNPDRRKAFALRLEGKSWEEIGNALGYSGTTVYTDLSRSLQFGSRQPNICYPAIRTFVVECCGGSVSRFAADCGISVNTMYTVLRGMAKPRKPVLDAILSTTGLTYEQAFQEE